MAELTVRNILRAVRRCRPARGGGVALDTIALETGQPAPALASLVATLRRAGLLESVGGQGPRERVDLTPQGWARANEVPRGRVRVLAMGVRRGDPSLDGPRAP